MSMERETYTELVHSMMFAVAKMDLSIGQVASVLYACAQQDTTEETIDLTRRVRDQLTDWTHESKGRIIAIEGVRLVFQCQNVHGPCKRGEHAVLLTRILGSNNWDPSNVVSVHDFDQVVLEATQDLHPNGRDEKFVVSHGNNRHNNLNDLFAEMFTSQGETLDDKVKDFRAELDALFPSNPPNGKEEGNESS